MTLSRGAAPLRRFVGKVLTSPGFGTSAPEQENGFVGEQNCFVRHLRDETVVAEM
jgi:hypothetical protein